MAPIGKHRQSLGVPRMKSVVSDTTLQGEKPPTTLKLWIIRIQSGGVVVEGYKAVSENDSTTLQNWRSTPIATRIDSKTLQTHSGSIYKLKGGIDEDEAAEAGIPEELIEAFANGFPENWGDLIHDQLQQREKEKTLRRQSMNTTTTNNSTIEDEGKGGKGKTNGILRFDDTMETEETGEDDERLKDAKKRRSIQKGRKSMMHRVQPVTPIEEEEEEEEGGTPGRGKTPARRKKTSETPVGRKEERKTPRGRGREGHMEMDHDEEEEDEPMRPSTAIRPSRTPKGGKKTPRGREKEEEEEVFVTPDETPRGRDSSTRMLSLVAIPKPRKGETPRQGRVSMENIPREISEKAIRLSRWVIRFIRGGTATSIFPHFQFKCCGFRSADDDMEWNTSSIQKVVPPHLLFTSSSIYLLDGQLDVDSATEMGFPHAFITDFLMGFPDDWDMRLETFFNKTFGPPPQPRIVELMSDGGTADEGRMDEKEKEKEKSKKKDVDTPRTSEGQKNQVNGLKFHYSEFNDEMPGHSRKRKEPTPSSSSSDGDESESDGEKQLRREAMKVEKEERRKEERARREAEAKAKANEEKKKRFEVKVNKTPDGVPVSRSGRTLRTPLATWAGENITYDSRGNVVDMTGVTTTTKMTVGKTNTKETERLAAHYGIVSPLNEPSQKERAIAPPLASLPKTPAPKKSVADYRGFSDDETEQIPYNEYLLLKKAEMEATPAYNLKKGKRRCRVVESSDSEAEEAERMKEEKRRKKEERRRLKESEDEESSDEGMRRKKSSKTKKKVVVKKEKQVKRVPSKKRRTKKEESEEEEERSDQEIEHDEDALTFELSEEGSNAEGGHGYSDDDLIGLEDEREEKSAKKSQKKKQPVKRAREWKKEELVRLKLAIQAADPSSIVDGWENVAKSLGGERTAEECKKIARERLKIKVDEPRVEEYGSESGAESGAASEDEEKKKRTKAKLNEDDQPKGVNAKKGTVQYAVEMENKKREMMMGAGASQDDYFKNNKETLTEAEVLPSVAMFDPDDSLLSLFDDDDLAAQPKQRTTKTAKAAAATPATPFSSLLDGSAESARRSARRSSAKFVDSPVINQDDMTRYVHQLSRSKHISMLSKSVVDRSRMVPPKLPKGRNAARAAEAIDKAENKLKNRGRRANEMDDLDEDEENGGGNILDGLL